MQKKIEVLNAFLQSPVTIQMPFPPVMLTCTKDKVYCETGDCRFYSCIVRSMAGQFYIFEFSEAVYIQIETMRFRHGSVQHIEFNVFLYENGELGISVASTGNLPVSSQVAQVAYDKYEDLSLRIEDRYKKLKPKVMI